MSRRRRNAPLARDAAPAPAPPAPARPSMILLLGALGVAVLLRVIYVAQYVASAPYADTPIIDAAYYDRWAMRVAAGEGYGPLPFYLAPLYPYCLGAFYALFGHHYLPVYVLHAAMGVVSLLLVFALARRTFGPHAGVAAVLLAALYAPLAFMETKLLSETLGILLTLASLWLLIVALQRARTAIFLGAGLLLGAATLCRSANLLFVLTLLCGLAISAVARRTRRDTGALIATVTGVAMAILPVTIRNYAVSGDLVPIASNVGMTFAQGNNPNARGVISHPPGTSAGIAGQQQEEMRIAAQSLGRPVSAAESSRYWLGQGLAWIRGNPGDFLRLLARKALYAFTAREESDSYEFYYERRTVSSLRLFVVPFWAILALAIVGVHAARPSPDRITVRVIFAYLGTVLLTLLIFYAAPRYRLPAVPVLAVLAGPGLVLVWTRLRQRSFALPAVAAGLMVAAALLGWVPYPIPEGKGSFTLGNAAALQREAGNIDRAIELLQEALRVDPGSAAVHGELANTLHDAGRLREAVEHYRLAIEAFPDAGLLHYRLASALDDLGQADAAARHWQAALLAEPESAQIRINHGAALASRGAFDEAIAQFREAARLDPSSTPAHSNLGLVLLQAGRPGEALEPLREALRLDPGYTQARFFLAGALGASGRVDDAVAEYRRLLQVQPRFPGLRHELARMLARAGRLDEAIEAYEALLSAEPQHPTARAELQSLMARRNQASPPQGS